jgi:hypothetical protein
VLASGTGSDYILSEEASGIGHFVGAYVVSSNTRLVRVCSASGFSYAAPPDEGNSCWKIAT